MNSEYAHGHQAAVLKSHTWRTILNSAQYVVPYIVADSKILDVGCGPGSLTNDFGSKCPQGSVVGVDISEKVVEIAMASEHPANVSFEIVDAYNLPFANNSFDVVHAHQVLQHVSDPVALLTEMSRVVRPTGVIAVRDSQYSEFKWSPKSSELDKWLTTYISIAKFCQGEPDAGRHLENWALEASLDIVRKTSSKWVFETPEEVTWWGETWADRVLNSNFADHARTLGLLSDLELQNIHDGWISWSRSTPAFFVIPHDEVIARKGLD
ncbi:MAG: methyltransferase domain-containing protein [Ilumatobacteraceae bacterium]